MILNPQTIQLTYLLFDDKRDALTDKIMNAVLGGLSNWVADIANNIITAFTQSFAPNLTEFFSYFGYTENTLPSNWYGYSIADNMSIVDFFSLFAAIGYAFAISILVFSLLQIASAPEEAKDSVSSVIIRFVVSFFMITFAKDITDLFFKATESIWDVVISRGLQVGGGDIGAAMDGMVKRLLDPVATASGLLVLLICSIIILINFIKYMVEIIERYIVACIMYMAFPAVAGTFVSKQTDVMGSYIKMLVSQLFLLVMNLVFMKLAVLMGTSMFSLEGEAQFGENIPGAIYSTLVMCTFLKVAQKLDTYMRNLGLNPAATSGNLIDGLQRGAITAAGMGMGALHLTRGGNDLLTNAGFAKDVNTNDFSGFVNRQKDAGKNQFLHKQRYDRDSSTDGILNGWYAKGGSGDTALHGAMNNDQMRDEILRGGKTAQTVFDKASRDARSQIAQSMFGDGISDMLGSKFTVNDCKANGNGTFTVTGKDENGNNLKFNVSKDGMDGTFNSFNDSDGVGWNVAPSGRTTGNVTGNSFEQGLYTGKSGLTDWSSKKGISMESLAEKAGIDASNISGIQQTKNGVNLLDKNGNTIGFVGEDRNGNVVGGKTGNMSAESLTEELKAKNSKLRDAFGNNLNKDLQWTVEDVGGKSIGENNENGEKFAKGTYKVSDGVNTAYIKGINDVSELRNGPITHDNDNPMNGAYRVSNKAGTFAEKTNGTNDSAFRGNPNPNNDDDPFGGGNPTPGPEPTPTPGPEPTPTPGPEPTPTPGPEPTPTPGPEPTPTPGPEPTPTPGSTPTPGPEPTPTPGPEPTPTPGPEPNPAPDTSMPRGVPNPADDRDPFESGVGNPTGPSGDSQDVPMPKGTPNPTDDRNPFESGAGNPVEPSNDSQEVSMPKDTPNSADDHGPFGDGPDEDVFSPSDNIGMPTDNSFASPENGRSNAGVSVMDDEIPSSVFDDDEIPTIINDDDDIDKSVFDALDDEDYFPTVPDDE